MLREKNKQQIKTMIETTNGRNDRLLRANIDPYICKGRNDTGLNDLGETTRIHLFRGDKSSEQAALCFDKIKETDLT